MIPCPMIFVTNSDPKFMKYKSLFTLVISINLLAMAGSPQAVEVKEDSALATVIANSHRSTENKSRDKYRHPVETLAFFGTQPDMTVVEIWPGGGWYTEILAPLLADKGKLYAAHFSTKAKVPFFQKSLQQFQTKLANNSGLYGKITLTTLQAPNKLEIAPAGSADQVLTFRNIHNWMSHGQAARVFKTMHKALKPGGVLGVVEHRGRAGQPQDPQAKSGYVTEAHVILLAQQAGFKLIDKSEINANPKDNTQHPLGVWTLPPRLKQGDQDRDKYRAMGESDRMTLKFIKL